MNTVSSSHASPRRLGTRAFTFIGPLVAMLLASGPGCAPSGTAAAPQGVAQRCLFAYYPASDKLFAKVDLNYVAIPKGDSHDVSTAYVFLNDLDRTDIPSIDPTVLASLKDRLDRADVEIVFPDGARVSAATVRISDGCSQEAQIDLAKLARPVTGDYKIFFTLGGDGTSYLVEHAFQRRTFPWEKNTLGITDKVYAPFTPVKASGKTVDVVQRTLAMNDFGLWDSVISKGRELLARPMTVRYRLNDGSEGKWTVAAPVRLTASSDQQAAFHSALDGSGVKLAVDSTVEFDGCMKVAMTLSPGAHPILIDRLWVEIPMKNSEMPLYHYLVNMYSRERFATLNSGLAPKGTGLIWDSATTIRKYEGSLAYVAGWVNNFVPYIWTGGAERGITWFAENDRGWFTAKRRDSLALQELSRDGEALVLRVNLISVPTTIRQTSTLTFGLQATPVKPMMPNAPSDRANPNPNEWRRLTVDRPNWSGMCAPWGGVQVGSKGPYMDNWEIVDQICWAQLRNKGVMNKEWVDAFVKKYDPPASYGDRERCGTLAETFDTFATLYPYRPMLVYMEQHQSIMTRGEHNTYQDQWSLLPYTIGRWNHGDLEESYLRTHKRFYPQAEGWSGPWTNYDPTYADYGVWYADKWFQHGLGVYFDNDYWWPCYNYHISAAYELPDGRIQPSCNIWSAREYHKRVWNLLQYWRENRTPNSLYETVCNPNDLEFCTHFSNCYVTPVHGFATINLDLELGPPPGYYAFPPDFLRTETTGRQTGCYMGKVYAVLSGQGPAVDKLDHAQKARIEWGMSMVHEILRTAATGHPTSVEETPPADWPFVMRTVPKLEKIVRDFGYGERGVSVCNYWDDDPVAEVSSGLADGEVNREEPVKWIAMANPTTKEVLMVLASWACDPATRQPIEADAEVRLHAKALGFTPGVKVIDAETGQAISSEATLKIHLPAPFGVRIIRFQP